MLPDLWKVENEKKLMLYGILPGTAQETMLNSARYYAQQNDRDQLLVVMQTYCEFELGWPPEFDQYLQQFLPEELQQQFLERIDRQAMYVKPTLTKLRKLLRWRICRKNLLISTKEEMVRALYEMCRQPASDKVYNIYDRTEHYRVYWQGDCWHFMDVTRDLVWHLKARP